MPLVSVVIPAFNCEDTIKPTIDSINAQTFRDFEIIVVDDGSSDDTYSILDHMCNVENRIKLVTQQNSGQAAARNHGIRLAEGSLIAFCDSDDQWFPDKLALQIPLFCNKEVGLVYCGFRVLDDKTGEEIIIKKCPFEKMRRGDVLSFLLRENFVAHSGVIIRKCCFKKAGYFDESVRFSDDWDMLLRIAANYKFDFVDKDLIWYRINRAGQISKKVSERFESKQHIFQNFKSKYGHLVSDDDVKRFLLGQNINFSYYLRKNNPLKAFKHSIQAILLSPSEFKLYRSVLFCLLFFTHLSNSTNSKENFFLSP